MGLITLYLIGYGPAVLGVILAITALRSWKAIRTSDGDLNWKEAARIRARLGIAILVMAGIEHTLKRFPIPRDPSESTDLFAPTWATYLDMLPTISLIVLTLILGFWQALRYRLGRAAANGRNVALGSVIACLVIDVIFVTWFFEPYARWIFNLVFSTGMSPRTS